MAKQAGKQSAANPPALIDVAGTGNVAMVEMCPHRAIERARLETLHLPCARQFSTLPTSGMWKRSMVRLVRHRQTKGPATDRPLLQTRHICDWFHGPTPSTRMLPDDLMIYR